MRHPAVFASVLLLCGCSRSGEKRASADAGSAIDGAPKLAAAELDAAPPPPKGPRPDLNVVLLTIDSMRADMPWAGYARPIAPHLTELEKKSVSYTRGYAMSSYTSMSLGGVLAAKLPGELKRDGFFFNTFHKDNLFFPELLQKAGIKTLAVHAHGYFKDGGFHQGFDTWEIVPNLKWDNTTDLNITAPLQESLAEKLLADPRLERERFFAWFHFMDPHDQYMSHEPEVPSWGKTRRDLYDGEITFSDKYIGKLLEFVQKQPYGERTAFVVTSDHGEGLGEHNHFAHGFELWEMLVRVPFIIFVPGAKPQRIDVARSAIDLAPTICELFGVKPDAGFEGRSLVPELFGEPAEPRDVVLDLPMTSDNDRRRALLRGSLKLVAYGNDAYFHLYDVDKDPDETSIIARGPEYEDMKRRYYAFEKTVEDVQPYGCLPGVCLNGAYKMSRDGGK